MKIIFCVEKDKKEVLRFWTKQYMIFLNWGSTAVFMKRNIY